MDIREINYISKQTTLIVKIISVAIEKADNKLLEAKKVYKGNDLPEVYNLWDKKKKLWARNIENSLFKPYSLDSVGHLNKLQDFLNIMREDRDIGEYINDPILKECLGLKLEGDLCLPNVQEL